MSSPIACKKERVVVCGASIVNQVNPLLIRANLSSSSMLLCWILDRILGE
jgi:hypothetical protein